MTDATGSGARGDGASESDGRTGPLDGSLEGQPHGPLDRRVFVVAGVAFAVLMAFSTRYGFHADELYFLDSARHLQVSYVDQPVLAPLLVRVSLSLFGVSEAGLRLWPALAAAGTVVVGGLTAREFGGALLHLVGEREVLHGVVHAAQLTARDGEVAGD
ncbi:ArnT family glycosyltransferase, partial [Streptomyces sp. NPDC001770]